MRRARALLTIGTLLVAALIISGPAAIGQTRAPIPNTLYPGINHWFAKPQKPPAQTLLRFYMLEHTTKTPLHYRALACLYIFPLRPGKATREFPCAHVIKADLAVPGSGVTWRFGANPWPDWACKAHRRYFVSFSIHATNNTGQITKHYLWYSPFHKGSRVGILAQDWGKEIPSRRESHVQTSCKAVKGA